jgi:hypothetical protein
MATVLASEAVEEPGKSMPKNIKNMMAGMSEIRQTILVNQPQLLPILAPFIMQVEDEVNNLWQSLG